VTKRINIRDHRRPRRMLGESLTKTLLHCPVRRCGDGTLTVVAYRTDKNPTELLRRDEKIAELPVLRARLECRKCGYRFSVVVTEILRAQAQCQRRELSEYSPEFRSIVRGQQMSAERLRDSWIATFMEPSDTTETRMTKASYLRARAFELFPDDPADE